MMQKRLVRFSTRRLTLSLRYGTTVAANARGWAFLGRTQADVPRRRHHGQGVRELPHRRNLDEPVEAFHLPPATTSHHIQQRVNLRHYIRAFYRSMRSNIRIPVACETFPNRKPDAHARALRVGWAAFPAVLRREALHRAHEDLRASRMITRHR